MIIEILIAVFSGIFVGIFSGLCPGIHINMISLFVLSVSPFLLKYFNVISLGVFIISLGITHTFLDAVPSIFLGAPNESTALGVLPGHRYLLKGNGFMAVKLFTIGSFFGLILGILMFPLLILVTKISYPVLEKYFAFILIAVCLFMIFRDEKKLWAILVFSLSGIFGILVFNLSMKDPLFPMLSGLFGIATLIYSLNENNNIPEQKIMDETEINKKKTFFALVFGNISAFIVSTFPGLSSSIAAVMSLQFLKKSGDHGFMILMGCIGTCSFILSLVALYTVNKARNGAVIVISKLMEINSGTVLIFLSAAIIAGAVSVMLCLFFGRVFSRIIGMVNYKILVGFIIIFVTAMVFVLCGWIGLFILLISTCIGLIPAVVKVQRTQAMACLIVPVIVYFII